MRLIKKCFLFTTELSILFFGFVFSLGYAVFMFSRGHKCGPFLFILSFSLVCVALVWFRGKTEKWTTAADAKAFLTHRSWRRLHPRRAKYLRTARRWLIWLPSLLAAFVLLFLPVASHVFYFGGQFVPHYRVSIPLNWLVVRTPWIDWYCLAKMAHLATDSLLSGLITVCRRV